MIIISAKGLAEHTKLEAGTLCVADPGKFQAWELDYFQQARDEKTGKYTQFVSSLNQRPLKIFPNRPQIASQQSAMIAVQQFDEQLVQIHQENSKQSMLLWLGIFLLALVLTILTIVLVNMRG